MRIDLNTMRLSQRHDMTACANAATRTQIGLRNVQTTRAKQLAIAIKRVLVFTTGNGHAEFLPHFYIALNIFRHHGFLIPKKIKCFQCAPKPQGLSAAIGMVGVHH